MPPIGEVKPGLPFEFERFTRELFGTELGRRVAETLDLLATCLAEDRIVDWAEVLERTSLSKRTVQRLMETHEFPARVELSGARTGWRNSDIVLWMRSRPFARVDFDET